MILLKPALVQSAPEMATLEALVQVLDVTLVVLAAAHPCLESDRPACGSSLAPCHLAAAIHDHIDELDNAIIHYRATVEDALNAERDSSPLF